MTPATVLIRRLAIALNAAAALGCVALAAFAPTRAAALVAGGGFVFFALASVAFGLLLSLESGATAARAKRDDTASGSGGRGSRRGPPLGLGQDERSADIASRGPTHEF